jgi:hypothetical protein
MVKSNRSKSKQDESTTSSNSDLQAGQMKGKKQAQLVGIVKMHDSPANRVVFEYMTAFSHIVGKIAKENQIPLVYNVQSLKTNLDHNLIALRDNELPISRSIRLVNSLLPAQNSREPGLYIHSGSTNYAPFTSPIRKFQDLYNQLRFKLALQQRYHLETSGGIPAASHLAAQQYILSNTLSNVFSCNRTQILRDVSDLVAQCLIPSFISF